MERLLKKLQIVKSKIAYTVLMVVLLSVIFATIIAFVYFDAENEGFENLHIQTKEVKEDIELQMISDRENLMTMSNFASKLYSDGENYDLLFTSFKSIGLIENIGILLPDNTFVTKNGTKDLNGVISFEEEAARGEYISGRVNDLTEPDKKVVRSAVPVVYEGNTVAILYGVIELDTLENRYMDALAENKAQLFVLERGNGNLIINTVQGKLGNVSSLSSREYRKGFTFEQMYDDIKKGNPGFSSFVSAFTGENLYIHYSPLAVSDWCIMLAEPEYNVFSEARATGHTLAAIFVIVIIIMFAYILLMLNSERKQVKINLSSSTVRRLLLGINQDGNSVMEALIEIAFFAKARSAFFFDSDGENFKYIIPDMKGDLLTGDDKSYLSSALLGYMDKCKSENTGVHFFMISVDSLLRESNAELHDFFKSHNINTICFTVINNLKNTCVLGVINPKKSLYISDLLKDISVCFSMAIFNKKHLDKTEYIAVTDSLTGLSNRAAYKKALVHFSEKETHDFSCIYIDVNELHIINNKYGHTAGDGMLICIANSLKEVFDGSYIYRIGGDEFLVFTENVEQNIIEDNLKKFVEKIEMMNYHVSVGMSFGTKNINIEDLVYDAEKRMYEDKAMYYQRKEQKRESEDFEKNIEHIATGIRELDETLSIMSRHYRGIYCVSLKKDRGRRILMPAYFSKFSEADDSFHDIFVQYVHDMVNPDYHRALFNFLEYDVLKRQISDGYVPCITYTKNNDENIMLSVYPVQDSDDETLWIFEKK